jgi:hypothetical protein
MCGGMTIHTALVILDPGTAAKMSIIGGRFRATEVTFQDTICQYSS